MKTMKNLILILTFIFGLTLTSCSKYDDFLPEQDEIVIKKEEINRYQIQANIKIVTDILSDPVNNSYTTHTIYMQYDRDTLLTKTEFENLKMVKSIDIHYNENNYFRVLKHYDDLFREIPMFVDGCIVDNIGIIMEAQLSGGSREAKIYNDMSWLYPYRFFYYDNNGILKTTDNIKSFEFTDIKIHRDY